MYQVIVTGSAGTIGRAIVEEFEDRGMQVFGIDKHNCDLRDAESIAFCLAEAAPQIGELHCLVNCAGVSGVPWDETFKINVDAPWLISYALRWNLKGGSIVNICSLNAHVALPGNPAYVASKHALLGLTKALALDWAFLDIRVNSVSPGYVHTAMTMKSFSDVEEHKRRAGRTMNGRWTEAREVAEAVYFLSQATGITGTDVRVDGGWLTKGL